MKHVICLATLACALTACSEIPPQAYYNRGDPENLIDVSSEVVNLNLASPGALTRLSSMVAQEPPAHAELSCSMGETLCAQAKEIFDRHNIPSKVTGGGDAVTLVYQRVTARDCEQRYIDNTINPYNLNYLTFGCSVTANTVQEVSDKRQFTNPNLMDLPDATKAVENYEEYLKPPSDSSSTPSPMSSGGSSLVQSGAVSSIAGSGSN